jgi:type IX secretion system PorP/SprF family membrane protein
MRLFITLLFGFTGLIPLFAQQAPQYSLFALNQYSINPAYAGLDNTLVANGVYRQQWSNLQGAPVSQQVNAHLPISKISSGIGLKIDNDVIGAHRTTQALLSFSYHLALGPKTILALGAGAGFMQYALDGNKLRAPQGTYVEPSGIFNHNDQWLPQGKITAGVPVAEAGIFLQAANVEIGASVLPLFAPVLRSTGNQRDFSLAPVRHYVLYTAVKLDVFDDLMLKPAFLLKNDISETQMEISILGQWRENIFAGSSLRGFTASARDAVVIFGGFKLNERTNLGYAFDLPLSPLKAANRGSHELMLRYSLNKPVGAGKLPPIIYNPRFL